MNDNIKSGSDIHAGDGGYSLGTQEKYDEFVKIRNKSLAQTRIRELYSQAGLTMTNPLAYEQWYLDALEKFAELIVKECAGVCDDERDSTDSDFGKLVAECCALKIMERFGVGK